VGVSWAAREGGAIVVVLGRGLTRVEGE